MIGRRVKCQACGEVFTITKLADTDADEIIDLTEFEHAKYPVKLMPIDASR